MNPENTNTWKSWIDWWPTYLVLGISLAYFVDKTGICQKLTEKLFKKEATEKEEEY